MQNEQIQHPKHPPALPHHFPQSLFHYWALRRAVGLDVIYCIAGAVGSMFQSQGGGGASASRSQEGSSARAELLQGASQAEFSGKGGMRSAAEIRSAYGRSSTRCTYLALYAATHGVLSRALMPYCVVHTYSNKHRRCRVGSESYELCR